MQLRQLIQAAQANLGIVRLIIAFILGVLLTAYFALWFPEWTGFPGDSVPSDTTPVAVVIYDQPRDLWDWLQLLLVPAVLAIGGYYVTRSENRYALEFQAQLAAQTQDATRRIEEQNRQDAALNAYLDQMTQLVLDKGLRTSQPDDEVRSVARARSLTVLRELDGARKATVLQFLYETGLIGGINQNESGLEPITAIVSLVQANLERANLTGANLKGANLEEVNLEEANFIGANLECANLQGARLFMANLQVASLQGANLQRAILFITDLQGAELQGADLQGTYLQRAKLQSANLEGANLEGAILQEANLTGVILQGANLTGANLQEVDLHGANLEGANLEGVDLRKANLTSCTVTREQLAQAASLEDAILPFDM